jgi:alginate O-acetyltransferase complex protein AlgI
MLFNSIEFAFFLPAVLALHYLTPAPWRWLPLLAASCFFYAAFIPAYLLILAALIVIDYIAALLIERSEGRARRLIFLVSVLATASCLFSFKYLNFFNTNLRDLAELIGWNYSPKFFNWVLPVGLSFHTFQSLSYVIEVYRGRQKAERHPGYYALYVMFFPQLVAGPIERAGHLMPQLRMPEALDGAGAAEGLRRIAWGFFMKCAVADNLAYYVNHVYNDPRAFGGLSLLTAAVFFSFQVYGDFAGYSNIAIGTARLFGIRLRENFDRPFFAHSTGELWRRWHMSLTSWFRDYLYEPLGNRSGAVGSRWFRVMAVFLISGLWHGANWTYVLWGALNGCFILAGSATRQWRETWNARIWGSSFPRARAAARSLITFTLFTVALIFFRARTVSDAVHMITHLFAPGPPLHEQIFLKMPVWWLLIAVSGVLILLAAEGLVGIGDPKRGGIAARGPAARWSAYILLTAYMMLFIYTGAEKPFIYFDF